MTIIKLLLMLLSSVGFSGEVYISELYGNPPGSGIHKHSNWLEISHLGDRQIIINHFSLEIYTDKLMKALIRTDQILNPPVILDDFMLVAEAADLGLGLCLKSSIPVILLPDLSLTKARKICLAINNQAASCVILSKKDRFSDGVALFQPLISGRPSSFWLNEPCWLTEAIFATPGMPERACNTEQNFASDIFDECPTEIPKLSSGNFTNIWRETACVARHENAQLCYELSGQAEKSNQWGSLLRLKSRDLSGDSKEQSMRLETQKLNFGKIRFERIAKTRLELNLELAGHELPLNYQVKNRDGDLLVAGAFIEIGSKLINLDIEDGSDKLSVELHNINGLFERQELSLEQYIPKNQSCHSSGPLMLPWFLLYALGLLRSKAGFKR